MCRLLAYHGLPVSLERLIYAPAHSLVVQSYQPKELETALLNADGFGLGWYHPSRPDDPYVYRQIQPIWNDINLPHLCRYGESGRVLAYVRSATPGLGVDLHNCQPFTHGRLSFVHNGFIEGFRNNLYRPLRERLGDEAYRAIYGLTDSEHLFALVLEHWLGGMALAEALATMLAEVSALAVPQGVRVAANVIVCDGEQMVACRYDTTPKPPSLYWLAQPPELPEGTLIASEPLFAGNWLSFSANTLLVISPDREPIVHSLPQPGSSAA